MGKVAVLGFLGLISLVVAVPAPHVCSAPDPPSQEWEHELTPGDQDVELTQNEDGAIRVITQKDDTENTLDSYQSYPIPGGIIYLHSNPDVVIQPPPILIRPPQPKPIQPPPLEVEPPPLPPITPPSFYVRPPPLPPINVPSICVKPKPLPPITPPAMMVKPPCLNPIHPPPITIRQPDLPCITPPKIVVRPPQQANLQPPPIVFRTCILGSSRPLPHYEPSPYSCEDE